jgi:hypothetical protein
MENGFVLRAEIVADDRDDADIGVKRSGNGKVSGGTAEAACALAERGFDRINGDGANNYE